jgi:hypothetical protein
VSGPPYDIANRITTAGFAYDAAGNQVRALIPGSSNSQRFQYDAANRLVKVKSDDNQTIIASYTYGDSNQRLILQEAGVRIYYACDGSAEYTETGSATTPQWFKTYIHLGARLLSTLTPNGPSGHFVQYHHPDRLGTRLVTNAQDTNYFEQQTLPFGTALNESPPAGAASGSTNRRLTTYDRSLNTGLDYAINRHYDPQQGRFTHQVMHRTRFEAGWIRKEVALDEARCAPLKLRLIIIAVVFLFFVVIGAFYLFETTDVPTWRIRVLDQTGQPVSGVTVRQYWKNYTLESEPGENTEENQSDANGYLQFDRRSSKASIARRIMLTAFSAATLLAHGGIGVSARVSVLESITTLEYEPGRPLPHEVMVFRNK